VSNENDVYAWGNNACGQLGIGDVTKTGVSMEDEAAGKGSIGGQAGVLPLPPPLSLSLPSSLTRSPSHRSRFTRGGDASAVVVVVVVVVVLLLLLLLLLLLALVLVAAAGACTSCPTTPRTASLFVQFIPSFGFSF